MRVIVRQLWRAFPELDPFSDQQCRLFLRSARRTRRHMLRGNGLLASAFVLSLLMVGGVTFALFYHMRDGEVSWWPQTWRVLVSGGGFAVAAFGLLRLRDRTLRRSVLHLFATRGSCEACGHAMSGLPIPEDGLRCPECGHRKALLEVERTLDESGRVRFLPRPEGLEVHDPWQLGTKLRRLAKRAALVVIACVVLLGAAVGVALLVNEAANQADAKLAVADLAALSAPEVPPEPEVLQLLNGLARLEDRFGPGAEARSPDQTLDDIARSPDLVLSAFGVGTDVSSTVRHPPADVREIARAALIGHPSWRLLADVVLGRTAPPIHVTDGENPAFGWRGPPAASVLYRGHLAALSLCVLNAERGEWLQAAELLAGADALCRRLGAGRSVRDLFLSQRVQAAQLRVLHRLLVERPPSAFLDRIASSSLLDAVWVDDEALTDSLSRWVLGSAVAPNYQHPEALRWLPFADPEQITAAPSRSLEGLLARMTVARLGRYEDHRQALRRKVEGIQAALAGPADPIIPVVLPASGSHLVDSFTPMLSLAVTEVVRLKHDLALARVTLAVERFTVREGRRPRDLQELLDSGLCPHGLGALAQVTPAIRLTALPRADGRLVTVIYTAGPNGQDEGGAGDDAMFFPTHMLLQAGGVTMQGGKPGPADVVFKGVRPE